ncbi:MAG: 2-amino-4-hydroxy-6-hydroxymethyldihydropteridine diphosphokinase [Spirochaetaceae bacterium]|nr:MAG: 2-amino-4-hydroxy-6-hydroxymethyldihydropteridine diphosphokinase [Spirochaetaceae bacterium]
MKDPKTSCSEDPDGVPGCSVEVFLGLGSNVGRRLAQIDEAVERLRGLLQRIRVSSVYETEPMYVVDQPRFLNVVVSGWTRLDALQLLDCIAAIEAGAGRQRLPGERYGPRPLDIDILLYGRRIIDTPRLRVPHPRLLEREFVLRPLIELAPGMRDPRSDVALVDALAVLPSQGVYCYRANPYNRGRSGEQHT